MTPVQAKLYGWLLERIDDPVSPTYEEMRAVLGVASKSSVKRVIDALQRLNRVTILPNAARTIRAVRAPQHNRFDGIPSAALIDELKRRGELPDGR